MKYGRISERRRIEGCFQVGDSSGLENEYKIKREHLWRKWFHGPIGAFYRKADYKDEI